MPGNFAIARRTAGRISDPSRLWAETGFYIMTAVMDFIMIAAGLALGVVAREWAQRHGLTDTGAQSFEFRNFTYVLFYYWIALHLAFHYVDVYRSRRFLTEDREDYRIVKALVAFTMVTFILSFLAGPFFPFNRLTLVASMVYCSLYVLMGRNLIRIFREALRKRNLDIRVALILGNNETAQSLAAQLIRVTENGYRLVGFLQEENEKGWVEGVRVLGGYDRIERVCRRLGVDEIFLCEPDWDVHRIIEMFNRLRPLQLNIRLASRIFNVVIERVHVPVDQVESIPILDFANAPPGWIRQRIKRGIDLLLTGGAVVVLSPLLGLIALIIKWEDGGPVFFTQTRVGTRGRLFTCYKFRSMVVNAEEMKEKLMQENEAVGPMFKIRRDPRITRIGAFIRKYSLDEFPQLWNVLRGDMSLVGPRPPVPKEVAEYEPWHMQRLEGPVGVSGLWQVSGRNELTFDEMALLDIYYLKNQSLALDARIIVRTFLVMLLGKGG